MDGELQDPVFCALREVEIRGGNHRSDIHRRNGQRQESNSHLDEEQEEDMADTMHCRECEYVGDPVVATIDFDVCVLLCPECGAMIYDESAEDEVESV